MSNLTQLAPDRTEPPLHAAIHNAVEIMRDRYAEPITLNDLAAEVFVSPFHFSRMFAKATGSTPGRFLTAVRIFEAKRLLLDTTMTVSDIVCSVGYSSVGTFTSRFSRAVGMSPSQYRSARIRDLTVALAPGRCAMPPATALADAAATGRPRIGGRITARVELPAALGPATLLVGAFHEAIPQRAPVAFATVGHTGSTTITLDGVPAGHWLVLAVAEHASGTVSVGVGPGRISTDGRDLAVATARLRPMASTMPPMAFTLAGAGSGAQAPAAAVRSLHAAA